MANPWIVDVLIDVQQVAQRHELPRLADMLQQAIKVARVETSATDFSSNIDVPPPPKHSQTD